jgi:hypothetical protein
MPDQNIHIDLHLDGKVVTQTVVNVAKRRRGPAATDDQIEHQPGHDAAAAGRPLPPHHWRDAGQPARARP